MGREAADAQAVAAAEAAVVVEEAVVAAAARPDGDAVADAAASGKDS
jgi:hypothetical protein